MIKTRVLSHIALIIIILALVIGLAPTAFAQLPPPPTREYVAERQGVYQGMFKTYAIEAWSTNWYAHTLRWWADPQPRDGVNLRDQVAWVINNWKLMIPELQFEETLDRNYAHVEYIWDPAPDDATAGYTFMDGWNAYPDRQAAYWYSAIVYIHPKTATFVWDSNLALRGTIAHETGHLHGLDDRYRYDPVTKEGACYEVESTVMDCMLGETINGVMHITQHCDGLAGPDQIDHSRTDNFWSIGYLSDMTCSVNGHVATWTWKDAAWAEYDQNLQVFYWNGSGWTCYYNVNNFTNIGTHKKYDPNRILTLTIDHRNYGVPGGWQCFCGWPWFKEFNKFGTWQCKSCQVSQ